MLISRSGFDAANRSGHEPVNNLKVRQAMAHAIDRASLVKNLIRGDAGVIHLQQCARLGPFQGCASVAGQGDVLAQYQGARAAAAQVDVAAHAKGRIEGRTVG